MRNRAYVAIVPRTAHAPVRISWARSCSLVAGWRPRLGRARRPHCSAPAPCQAAAAPASGSAPAASAGEAWDEKQGRESPEQGANANYDGTSSTNNGTKRTNDVWTWTKRKRNERKEHEPYIGHPTRDERKTKLNIEHTTPNERSTEPNTCYPTTNRTLDRERRAHEHYMGHPTTNENVHGIPDPELEHEPYIGHPTTNERNTKHRTPDRNDKHQHDFALHRRRRALSLLPFDGPGVLFKDHRGFFSQEFKFCPVNHGIFGKGC